MENIYVYRNCTIEYLFDLKKYNYDFSSYNDISKPSKKYDTYIFFYLLPYKLNQRNLISEIKSYYNRLEKIISHNPNATYYIFTLYQYFDFKFVCDNIEIEKEINKFNQKLYNLSGDIRVIDTKDFFKKIPYDSVMDMKYYYLYDCIINPVYKDDFSKWFEDKRKAYETVRKKCLVLDLDNTLWYGVLGEEGIAGVKMNGAYPGNCFYDFQKLILELKSTGVILCIVSKNNKDDVDELFKCRQDDMVLKKRDFIMMEVSWERKDILIDKIAKTLNISLDSIVFIDDNKAEQDIVKKSLPEVTVLDFPDEPYLLSIYFTNEFKKYFSIKTLTSSDKAKTNQYKAKLKVDKYRSKFVSEEDFIKSLNMKIKYEYIDENNISRIEELINKSNQFNLTTKRYSKTELLNMKENSLICALRVKDRFDDLGIVAIAIVKFAEEIAEIDTFLLSCRVIGRGIEYDFLDIILKDLKNKGYEKIYAKYIRTKKNGIVSNFYEKTQFEVIKSNENETMYYKENK